MSRSLLEAIKQGDWSFEPSEGPGSVTREGGLPATTNRTNGVQVFWSL